LRTPNTSGAHITINEISPIGKQIINIYKDLTFFDPETPLLQINPKKPFRSKEISFMYKDVQCGIFL
jgi:hypothetical protein